MRTSAITFSLFASLAVSSFAESANAQTPLFLQTGQVATAGINHVGLLSVSGVTSSTYGVSLPIDELLWDPSVPDSFLASSGTIYNLGGQLVRVRFTSPTTIVTTPIAPTGQFAEPRAMTWNQAGTGVILLSTYHQLHSVDVATGVAISITTGAQPWGNTSRCMAVSPTTGDIYVGTSVGEIYRVSSGSGNAQLVQSGLAANLVELLVDGQKNELIFVSPSTVGRLALSFNAAANYYFGTLSTQPGPTGIRSAAFDQNGDIVLSAVSTIRTLPNVSPVPVGGLLPATTGSITYPNIYSSTIGCTVVGGTQTPFRLTAEAVAPLGAHFAIENTPNGTAFGFMLLSAATVLPVDTGPFFGLQPDILTFFVFNQSPTPGNILAWSGSQDPFPLTVPQFGMAPFFGQTWDVVGVAFGGGFNFIGRTNMQRVTW
ncbi:MAG: hypothetical protein ACI89X_000564 [Planctomycetota bacterium]|jgi:hypothetical protein